MEVSKVHSPAYAGRAQFVPDVVSSLVAVGLTREQAILFTAHVARETGYGRYVFNSNFGNIKGQNQTTGKYYILTDRLGYTDHYRAYDTKEDGLLDNVNLVRNVSRYRGAWNQLLSEDPNWYSTLGIEGYYEGPANPAQPGVHQPTTAANVGPAQADYNAFLRVVRQYATGVGAAPQTSSGSGPWLTAAALVAMGAGAWMLLERGVPRGNPVSRLTPGEDAAIRVYLLQPRDGSKSEAQTRDMVFDAFVRPTDRGAGLEVQTRINKAAKAARKAGYPFVW